MQRVSFCFYLFIDFFYLIYLLATHALPQHVFLRGCFPGRSAFLFLIFCVRGEFLAGIETDTILVPLCENRFRVSKISAIQSCQNCAGYKSWFFFCDVRFVGVCFRPHAKKSIIDYLARTSRNFLSKRRVMCYTFIWGHSFSRGWLSFICSNLREIQRTNDTNRIVLDSLEWRFHASILTWFFLSLSLVHIAKGLIRAMSEFHRLNIVCPVTRSEMSPSVKFTW